MEHQAINYSAKDLEDGELIDSDDAYTPLQRPDINLKEPSKRMSEPTKMEEALESGEEGPSDFTQTSSSTDSDEGFKVASQVVKDQVKTKKKRTVLLRSKTIDSQPEKQARFKKYNIWTASLQEETLMENMRGFDVAKYPKNDRSVETYDFSLKYSLNGEHSRKRRRSPLKDAFDDMECSSTKRRNYAVPKYTKGITDKVMRKLSSSSSDSQNSPRYILDLTVGLDSQSDEIARDIANKLYEEKDELLIRAVEVLGKELPISLFKETQKIERDGGMMVMNGKRRRTPGGVFLFLLKHHDDVSQENKKLIFHEETKKYCKEKKTLQAMKREKKVEELKKRLSMKDIELSPLSCKTEFSTSSHLKPETHVTLSNPPPSPVMNGAQENSPEYSSHAINHVNDVSPEKPLARPIKHTEDDCLTPYEDDFLDMNCDDMDLF